MVVLRKKSSSDEPDFLVGEEGADLDNGWRVISDGGPGSSREMLRFWRRENFGMGRELGGGEFE